jgi:hypothetical protein
MMTLADRCVKRVLLSRASQGTQRRRANPKSAFL